MLNNNDYFTIFHEIKNSITLVGSSLQLIEKKHPEVIDFDYWEDVMAEVSSLKNMVTELSAARLTDHVVPVKTDLSKLLFEVNTSIRSLLPLDHFTCEMSCPKNLPLIELDARLMKQAIINLLKNAYEAMGNTGTASVTVTFDETFVYIAVTDHGGGLDANIDKDIFDPFITTKPYGSGLGLAITKKIVDAHNGTLSYVSRSNDGCTFTVKLPISQS